MFNFNINWDKVIKENLHKDLHTTIRLDRIRAMIKPFKVIYAEFIAWKDQLFYKASFNGAIIYLEKSLNDRFDPIGQGIYITEFNYQMIYWYLRSESKPSYILYRRHDPTINYVVGQFAWKSGIVWECNTNHINKTPGVDPEWTITPRTPAYLRFRSNFNGAVSFIVNVPSAVTFDMNEMKSHINYYKLAGPGYTIKIV